MKNKQLLKTLAKENNCNSAEQLQKNFKEIINVLFSIKTLVKKLHQIGIFSYIAVKKSLTTEMQYINQSNDKINFLLIFFLILIHLIL